jgi:EmrB/QacA subfamily drug resistance transporter
VLAVAGLGVFMAFLDATIVNIAFPSIQHSFRSAGIADVSWVLNAYNVVFAAFLVIGGQFADVLGRRRMFIVALTVFTVASGLCAVSGSLGLLIAARVAQAIGAATVVPCSLAIVMEAFPVRERSHAVALWTAVAALAAGVGPSVGGVLVSLADWRLVFLVNLPIGVVGIVLASRALIESRAPGRRRIPDMFGALMLAVVIAALTLALVQGNAWGWTSARVLALFAAVLVLGAAFVWRCSWHRLPVLDLALFRVRGFALANGVTVIAAAGFFAYTLANVLFLTRVWHYSILDAGLAMTPGPITAVLLAVPASRLVDHFGHRAVLAPALLIWAAGMVFFATTLGSHPAFASEWLPGMVMLGAGAGGAFPTASSAAVNSAPGERFATATAINSVARQVGAVLGVALLIAILGARATAGVGAFHHVWLFAAGCFAAATALALALVVTHMLADQTPHDLPAALDDVAVPTSAAAATPALQTAPQNREGERRAHRLLPFAQSDADFLGAVPVFAQLSAPVREEIAAVATNVRIAAGDWLFRQSDPGESVYVVRAGHLEVVKETATSHQTLGTFTRGAVLGELAVLADAPRSASVRALRDSDLLQITREHFDRLLASEPALARTLIRVISTQLQKSHRIPDPRRPVPVTIALTTLAAGLPMRQIAEQLAVALSAHGRVAMVLPGVQPPAGDPVTAYAAIVDRLERAHDQVLLLCGLLDQPTAWTDFCLAQADRILALVAEPPTEARTDNRALHGCDLVGYDIERGSGALAGWIAALAPATTHAVRRGPDFAADVARTARRLSGHSIGIVLAGGGARAFAHLGVLEALLGAGVQIDRVGGVSMGAFIGAMLASELSIGEIDAHCYDEWVARNPINDYTLPRHGLIRGAKAEAMLDRVLGNVCIEELPLSFYSAAVDLRRSELVIDRDGSLVDAVAASVCLPVIAPPRSRGQRLLVDGAMLDNLPVAPMSATGEGPVVAVDVKAVVGLDAGGRPDSRSERAGTRPASAARRPSMMATMARVALLSSANTSEAARSHANLTIDVRLPDIGLLEFHQIDRAKVAGRAAAAEALARPPAWLFGASSGGTPSPPTILEV